MSPTAVDLGEYRRRRDFRRTREPRGGRRTVSTAGGRYVVQRHAARRLHYDFRLEHRGVLLSWAVPRGPGAVGERRLAVRTEDHPLEYADFEGEIPAGEYGAGKVIVWDTGIYRNLREEDKDDKKASMTQSVEEGHIAVWLEGKKLQGGYALIRTGRGKEDRWLLVKMN